MTLPLPLAVRTALPVREVDAAEARELSFGRSLDPRGIAGVYGALGPTAPRSRCCGSRTAGRGRARFRRGGVEPDR